MNVASRHKNKTKNKRNVEGYGVWDNYVSLWSALSHKLGGANFALVLLVDAHESKVAAH